MPLSCQRAFDPAFQDSIRIQDDQRRRGQKIGLVPGEVTRPPALPAGRTPRAGLFRGRNRDSAGSYVDGRGYHRIVKVRDLIRKLESTRWVLRSTKGSHRQFKHPDKPLIVTVAGHPGKDVPIGTLRAILKAAELEGDR